MLGTPCKKGSVLLILALCFNIPLFAQRTDTAGKTVIHFDMLTDLTARDFILKYNIQNSPPAQGIVKIYDRWGNTVDSCTLQGYNGITHLHYASMKGESYVYLLTVGKGYTITGHTTVEEKKQ